ncbi:MAG: hypothetical protein RIC56_15510 [Pseudomonadales bacterium]
MLKHVMGNAVGTKLGEGSLREKDSITLTRGLQWFHGVVGLTFAVLALLHVPHPSPWLWVPYASGAVLAWLTLIPSLSILVSRVLAIAATALMFFFFAGFFMEVPRLASDWYQSQEGWSAVARLIGAFTLIPVLSDYSCRCKAECREARVGASAHGRRHVGFFSAPDQAPARKV